MLYAYVISRDYGFAPNPFGPYCTLATCKPRIRLSAQIGDWVVGTGSAAKEVGMGGRLVYAMQVAEKLSYAQYWDDQRFCYKRPVMNGSLKQKYGDNIYRYDPTLDRLVQVNSHHSLEDGATNEKNYTTDTGGRYALIASRFWYFGREALPIPVPVADTIVHHGIGHSIIADGPTIDALAAWLSSLPGSGYVGKPLLFGGGFRRYRGD